MYGLINSSLQNMVREKFGDDKWAQVLKKSGVAEDSFLTMRSYDDAITYSLAGAASDVLGAPVDACLEMFGEYWVLETATNSYGMLLDAAGTDMYEFLGNMNALHDRITSTFLDYVPPELYVDRNDDGHQIHYLSKRKGLTPFVVGLLKGLAIRFEHTLNILEQREIEVKEGTHTVFQVELTPK